MISKKRSRTKIILGELSIPKSAEELSKIFPYIKKGTISAYLSVKVSEGILAKTETIPRRYVLKHNEKLFRNPNVNTLPTVQERIGSLKKMPDKFSETDFAIYWSRKGYDYDTIENSFDYIVSILKNKKRITKVDGRHWMLKKESTLVVHKKEKNKIVCGYNSIYPFRIKSTQDDNKVTCMRCIRDMILKLSGDKGKSQKKKWIKEDRNILLNRLNRLKRAKMRG